MTTTDGFPLPLLDRQINGWMDEQRGPERFEIAPLRAKPKKPRIYNFIVILLIFLLYFHY
jgi:hypothetical protein